MPPLDDEALRTELPPLRRFALSLVRDPSAADDLVQATLERAISREALRREDGGLRAWLFSILYRQFLDRQRRARRFARFLDLLKLRVVEAAAPSAEESVIASRELAAFTRLSEGQRAVLLLVAVEGLSYQEASNVLGVPIGTVMSRLSRARGALAMLVDGEAPQALRLVR